MKVFGHPLHMMLIHFPSALFPMDLVCSVLAICISNPSLTDAAFYAQAGGVCFGWLALVTGMLDMIPVVKSKPDAVSKGLIHGFINGSVVLGYSVIVLISYKSLPDLSPDGTLLLVVKGVLVAAMLAGNFLGGSLVLKEKVTG